MTRELGAFVWFEIASPDIPRAQAFHGEVLGWKVQTGGPYRLITAGEVAIGGYISPRPGLATGWLSYLSVDDVDATAERARAAGGAVVRSATDITGVGRWAQIADPEGATVGVYRAKDGDRLPAPGPGRLFWTELLCRTPVASLAFYEKVADFAHSEMVVDGAPYYVLEHGGVQRGGITVWSRPEPTPGWLSYVTVDDCDAAVARVRTQGGTVYDGPADTPGIGRTALVADRDGTRFGLITPVASS
jgi:predicted enzyme related to lactoylglutathione lyase